MSALVSLTGIARSKNDVFRLTAFTRGEMPLLDKILTVSENLRRQSIQSLLIGGCATRLYMDPLFKGRSGNLIATDIDLIAFQVPDKILRVLQEKSLCFHRVTFAGAGERSLRIDHHETVFKAYTFPQDQEFKVFERVDLFIGQVGRVIIQDADFGHARSFSIEDSSSVVQVPLADPGLLLATILNPEANAKDDVRLQRAVFVLRSLANEAKTIGQRYAQILQRGNLPTAEEFSTLFGRLLTLAGKKAKDTITQFVHAAQRELGLSAG